LLLLLAGCTEENNTPNPGAFAEGIYVVNEGPFSAGSGTLSYRDARDGSVETDVYFNVNGLPAGAVLQSMIFTSSNEAWLVSNLSGTLEALEANTFVSKGKVFGLGSPRYVVETTPGMAAVSDWASNSVYFVDMQNFIFIDTVGVGQGPEQLVYREGKLFVAHSGGFSRDSTISIIDLQAGTVQTVVVGDQPGSMVYLDNSLFVLCSGYSDWVNPTQNTPGSLVKIDPITGNELDRYDFDLGFGNPARLSADAVEGTLFFLNNGYGGALYTTDIALSAPQRLRSGNYYSTGFDPIRREILLANPLNFSTEGYVVRLQPNGTLLDSFQVGLIPTNFAYR